MSNPNDISLTLLLFSMLLLSPLKDTHAQDFIRQLETQGKASFQFTPPFDDSTELDDIEKIEMFGAGDGQMSIVLGFGRRPGRYVISLKNGQFSEYVDARDIDYDRSPRSNHAAGFLQRHVVGTGPSYPRNDTMIARAPTVTFGKTTYHYLDAHLLDVTPGKVILRMKVAVPNENKGFNKSDILVAADDELKPLEPVTGTFPGESIDQCTSANGLIYIESEWIDTDSPRIRLRHHWVIDSHEKDAVLQHCTFNSQDIYGPNPNPSVVLFNNCDPKVVPSQLGRALVWVDVEEYFVHNKEKGVIARPFPFADDFVAAGLIKADEQLAVYGETKSGQPHVIHLLDVDTGREVQSIHLDGVQRGRVEIQGCQTGKRFCVAYETVSGRRFDVYELDDEEGWALIFRSTDTIDIDVISHWDLDDLGQHIAYCTDENLVVLRVDAVTPRKHGKQGQDRSSPLTGISRNDLGFEDTPANVDKAFVGFLPDKASFESFSPNERWSVGNLEGSRKLGFYNLVDNTLTERVVGDEEMTAAAWTGNGTTVATAHTDRIYVWSVEGSTKALATSDSLQAMSQNLEREQREVVSGTFKSIDWVHDGKRLLCTSIEGVAIFQVDGRDIMLESCVGTSNLGCDFDQKSGRLLVLKPDNEVWRYEITDSEIKGSAKYTLPAAPSRSDPNKFRLDAQASEVEYWDSQLSVWRLSDTSVDGRETFLLDGSMSQTACNKDRSLRLSDLWINPLGHSVIRAWTKDRKVLQVITPIGTVGGLYASTDGRHIVTLEYQDSEARLVVYRIDKDPTPKAVQFTDDSLLNVRDLEVKFKAMSPTEMSDYVSPLMQAVTNRATLEGRSLNKEEQSWYENVTKLMSEELQRRNDN